MRENLEETDALMILNALPNVGSVTISKLLNHFGADVLKVFAASFDELCAINGVSKLMARTIVDYEHFFDLKKEKEKLNSLRGSFVGFDSLSYPALLREIYDFPVGLYTIGEDIINSERCIAIIGARKATVYGMEVARKLAYDLASKGFCIVSGMARGIDSCAHEGALAAHGKTIAILGNGIDIIYPAENTGLYRRIADYGALISEFPIGRRADKQTFPIRNRLISGMCHAVVVVESDESGGSMITARFAAEHGRQVFAVPGRIDSSCSRGCHKLIREGGTLLTSADDICEDLLYLGKQQELNICGESISVSKPEFTVKNRIESMKEPLERNICNAINDAGAATIEEIAVRSLLPSSAVMSSLLMLEIKKIVVKRMDGRYELKL